MRIILKPFASLRLTVALLALTMILVFAGTWAQIDTGIWQVQKTYFHSFFCWIGFNLFLPRETLAPGSFWTPIVALLKPIGFPMLGGYSIIALLLLNLLSAHTVRFKFNRKRIGVILIHAGLILLILGEVVTSVGQVESRMTITEGQTVAFSEDVRSAELAIIDHSPAETDSVVAVPASRLQTGATLASAAIPFELKIDAFYSNSKPLGPFQASQANVTAPVAVKGIGEKVIMVAAPRVSGTDGGDVDAPSAYITLLREGKAIGSYLFSLHIDQPETIDIDGKKYDVQLRWKRLYKSYSVHLIDFAFDRYTGTNVPKNYSSLIHLSDPSAGEDRDVKVWMNHPLRHAGETIYQASFDNKTERTTVLQIVRNPGWLIPYLSCSIITLGLLIHFGMTLVAFLKRGASPAAPMQRGGSFTLRPIKGNILVASIVTGSCLIFLLAAGRPARVGGRFDLHSFGRVPISYEGRVLPLDSLARNSLRILSGRSTFNDGDVSKPAIAWLIEVFAKPTTSYTRQVFRIDNQDVLSALGLDVSRKLFTFEELRAKFATLDTLSAPLKSRKPRDAFEKGVGELVSHVNLFGRLQEGASLFVAPPTRDDEEWKTLEQSMRELQAEKDEALARPNPGLAAYVSLLQTYASDKPDMFNETADGYLAYLSRNMRDVADRTSFEVLFNDFEPFYNAMVLYVLAFLLVVIGWLGSAGGSLRATLHRTAYWVLTLTLIFHTFGLVARIYISGRPPVTNLYSSAIFIGWFVVLFSLIMERLFKNGIGSLTASAIAFPTLLIAHHLANSPVLTPNGDTMEMLQAVLDTNIWLATHVVIITLGYSATFLAWIIGVVYVVGGMFTRSFASAEAKKSMSRMLYGVVCFAMLFSFVGTILGGIWADQSWGRFWGWDPKENGAVLIVLWNAIVLHARWAGLVRERGLANLVIFGGVVTAWSWFGTNMLGVGLHSYGFMEAALVVLCAFAGTQLSLILMGSTPLRLWRSYRPA